MFLPKRDKYQGVGFLTDYILSDIRTTEYTISVLELEHKLLELPYISEAYSLPVLDYEEKGMPAALVRMHMSGLEQRINLKRIRDDLAKNMETYKLPRLLRILGDGEIIPKTRSQKVLKKEALRIFFGIEGVRPLEYCVEGVEFWDGS